MGITAAKPGAFSFDSGATWAPDLLWMLDEGTGNPIDEVTGKTLTLTGADWITDATHGPALQFISANSDLARATSINWGAGSTLMALIDAGAAPGGVGQCMISAGDSAANNNFQCRHSPGGDLASRSVLAGVADTDTTTQDIATDTGFSLVSLGGTDALVGVSMNDSNFITNVTTHTGLSALIDKIALGCEDDNTQTGFADMVVIAFWFYQDVILTNTNVDEIWNGGDPWPMIGVNAASGAQPKGRMLMTGIG